MRKAIKYWKGSLAGRCISFFLIVVLLSCMLASCNEDVVVDYPNVADFEAALNAGEDLTGKTVTFTVNEVVPDSAFGYNLQTGEHLNFCSEKNPGVKAGDTVTVRVVEVSSLFGSYIIDYELI